MQVHNYLEDAFQAQLRIYLPQNVDFVNIVNNKDLAVSCSLQMTTSSENSSLDVNNNNNNNKNNNNREMIVCDLGNPLPSKHLVKIELKLDASKVGQHTSDQKQQQLESRLEFRLEASSKNAEDPSTTFDNLKTVLAKVEPRVQLALRGAPLPEQVRISR